MQSRDEGSVEVWEGERMNRRKAGHLGLNLDPSRHKLIPPLLEKLLPPSLFPQPQPRLPPRRFSISEGHVLPPDTRRDPQAPPQPVRPQHHSTCSWISLRARGSGSEYILPQTLSQPATWPPGCPLLPTPAVCSSNQVPTPPAYMALQGLSTPRVDHVLLLLTALMDPWHLQNKVLAPQPHFRGY